LAISLGIGLLFLMGYFFCLPHPLFKASISQFIEDRARELLSARIAADRQWRFPAPDEIPKVYFKYKINIFLNKNNFNIFKTWFLNRLRQKNRAPLW
jgi:membrane carboxypeptidase/penicillin-binding protein PbpC